MKKVVYYLAAALVVALYLLVGEMDYQNEVISTHQKCDLYPQLSECINYDDSEYLKLMGESK